MDLIKGLKSGFCHTWVTGCSKERLKIFNSRFKSDVNEGHFIRDIQNAPRDARYKIDHYYRNDVTEDDTVKYPYIDVHLKLFKRLSIDETFNWTKELKNVKGEYEYNDITIGYGEYDYFSPIFYKIVSKSSGYYFKYKGEINTLIFNYGPELVDYSDKFWSKLKGKKQYYDTIDTLLHNINYFLQYKKTY